MTATAKKVKQAARAAEKAHEEAYGKPGEPPKEEATLEVVEGEQDHGTPPVEAEPKAEVVETPPEPPEDPRASDPKFWEGKYKTLQGMYNKDVPELRAQVTELIEKNQSMEKIIATMQRPNNDEATPVPSQITDADVEDYGPDMIDLIKRAAAEQNSELLRKVESLEQQNLQLSQSVGTFNAKSEADLRQRVFDSLARDIPDWQQINIEPEFLEWLAEQDILAGDTRQNLLNQAFELNDAPRVVGFFKKYVADRNVVTGQGNQTDTPSPTVNLDTLVAPGKPQQAGQAAPSEDDAASEIWTNAEIQAFYTDVQKGKFKDNPKEKDALERRIHRAINEGRVR